jgi:adenylyl cyclase-associated protein
VSCTKTSVLLDSTVSALSVTSSPSFTVQILGVVPTILVDASDSGQIYLSEHSLGVQIVTSKASAINVSLPKPGGEEGEFVERAVPEQFKTVVKDGKLETSVVEHAS